MPFPKDSPTPKTKTQEAQNQSATRIIIMIMRSTLLLLCLLFLSSIHGLTLSKTTTSRQHPRTPRITRVYPSTRMNNGSIKFKTTRIICRSSSRSSINNGERNETSLRLSDAQEEQQTQRKLQLRVDGWEPYALVSAITSSASFNAVTSGNTIFTNDLNWYTTILLLTSTLSCCLGLYALGTFSFSIMYAKAALAREGDDSCDVYQEFYQSTVKYRFKGYQAFFQSLLLFMITLFLFAISYLPDEPSQIVAAIGSFFIVSACWKDWQDMVQLASIIYDGNSDDMDTAGTVTTTTTTNQKSPTFVDENPSTTNGSKRQ